MKKLTLVTLSALMLSSCAVSVTFGGKKDKPYGLDLTKNEKGGLDAKVIKPVKNTIPVMIIDADGNTICKEYTEKEYTKEFGTLPSFTTSTTTK